MLKNKIRSRLQQHSPAHRCHILSGITNSRHVSHILTTQASSDQAVQFMLMIVRVYPPAAHGRCHWSLPGRCQIAITRHRAKHRDTTRLSVSTPGGCRKMAALTWGADDEACSSGFIAGKSSTSCNQKCTPVTTKPLRKGQLNVLTGHSRVGVCIWSGELR